MGTVDELEDELVAKDAEIARLKEALEPFAEYADDLDLACIPDTARIAYAPIKLRESEPSARDCRHARAALKGETERVEGVQPEDVGGAK